MTKRLALATRDTFRSLRHRNFRLFFAGQLISQTGTWLTMVTQVLLVLNLTDSGIALGVLTACQFGPILVLGAWAGAVADRADKRRLLLVLQTGAMAQSLALGLVVLSGNATVGIVYALAFVQGVLTAFDNPARRSFVVEMVPSEDVPNAVGLNTAVMTGSRVVGPALAGALVVTVGFGWAFIVDGAQLPRGDLRLVAHAPAASSPRHLPPSGRRARSAPGCATSGPRTPLVRAHRDDGDHRHLRLQLRGHRPAARQGSAGGRRRHLHRAVLGAQPRLGVRCARHRPAREVTSRQLVIAAAGFGVAMLGLAMAPITGASLRGRRPGRTHLASPS